MKNLCACVIIILICSGCTSLGKSPITAGICPQYEPRVATLMGSLSNLAYEQNRNRLGSELSAIGFTLDPHILETSEYGKQGYIAYNDETVIVSFAGTQDVNDWLENAKAWSHDKKKRSACNKEVAIHQGFYKAISDIRHDDKTISRLRELQQSRKLYFTGHSLGGALSTILAYYIVQDYSDIGIAGVYTFGQPFTGDDNFQECYDAALKDRTFRFVNQNDIIPLVKIIDEYEHVGTALYFDSDGEFTSDLSYIKPEKIKDYFSTDHTADHLIGVYLDGLAKNKDVNPFSC